MGKTAAAEEESTCEKLNICSTRYAHTEKNVQGCKDVIGFTTIDSLFEQLNQFFYKHNSSKYDLYRPSCLILLSHFNMSHLALLQFKGPK